MSTFNDVRHKPLQAYNRAMYATNILLDQGPGYCEEYVDQFSSEDKTLMYDVLGAVRTYGTKWVVDRVTEGLVFTDNDHKEKEDG